MPRPPRLSQEESAKITQKVLDYLSKQKNPVHIKDIADNVGITTNSTTRYLSLLHRSEHIDMMKVVSSNRGRRVSLWGLPNIIAKAKKEYTKDIRVGKQDKSLVLISHVIKTGGISGLLAAVLERAHFNLLNPQDEKMKRKALEWFLSEEDEYCFDLASICDYLGFNRQAIVREICSEHIETQKEMSKL